MQMRTASFGKCTRCCQAIGIFGYEYEACIFECVCVWQHIRRLNECRVRVSDWETCADQNAHHNTQWSGETDQKKQPHQPNIKIAHKQLLWFFALIFPYTLAARCLDYYEACLLFANVNPQINNSKPHRRHTLTLLLSSSFFSWSHILSNIFQLETMCDIVYHLQYIYVYVCFGCEGIKLYSSLPSMRNPK